MASLVKLVQHEMQQEHRQLKLLQAFLAAVIVHNFHSTMLNHHFLITVNDVCKMQERLQEIKNLSSEKEHF